MKEFKNLTKFMVGLDALERVSYEVYYHNCRNVLVIYDNDSDICGGKRKLKHILANNKINIKYVKVDGEKIATWKSVEQCYQLNKQNAVDCIICLGSSAVADIGKAVKALISIDKNSFEGVKEIDVDDKIQLVVVLISTGDHCNLASGCFNVFDENNNIFYKFNCKNLSPNIVALDRQILDNISEFLALEMQLTALCMSFLALAYCENDNNKIYAMIAIDIIDKALKENKKLNLIEIISAQMYAGISFMNIKKNIVDEFVCQAMVRTNCCYDRIFLNAINSCFAETIFQIQKSDIAMIGNVFGATFKQNQADDWKEQIVKFINDKKDEYFANKNIAKGLSSIGLNEKDIQEIFEEMATAFDKDKMNETIMQFQEILLKEL